MFEAREGPPYRFEMDLEIAVGNTGLSDIVISTGMSSLNSGTRYFELASKE